MPLSLSLSLVDKWCLNHNILVESYSPLGSTGAPQLADPIVSLSLFCYHRNHELGSFLTTINSHHCQFWAPRGPNDVGQAENVLGKDLPTPLELPY
ncbi:hypothetical protein OIO90_005172 [Microbotryomycetes sp. JL221]|nr:hypothetical protein OIO90_005172 [Microbotryomycetes sp. JL221]